MEGKSKLLAIILWLDALQKKLYSDEIQTFLGHGKAWGVSLMPHGKGS
jgi:hypothetical protein